MIYAGMDWRWQIASVIAFILGTVAIVKYNDRNFHISVLIALTLAMLLHAWAIFFPPAFVIHGINTETGFWVTQDDQLGIFFGRHTGFTAAPGYLSLLASVGFAMGIQLLIIEKKWPWCLLVGASLLCGFASGNRSFLVAIIISIATTIILIGFRRNIKEIRILFALILAVIMISYFLWTQTIYGEYMYSRLIEDVFVEDINTRIYNSEFGNADIGYSILQAPVFGSLELIPGTTSAAVYSGTNWFQPHNSIVWIIGSRGVVAGSLFLGLSLLALVNLYRRDILHRRFPHRHNGLPSSVFIVGFIAGQIVGLFDPMLETGLMLFLLGTGLGSSPMNSKHA